MSAPTKQAHKDGPVTREELAAYRDQLRAESTIDLTEWRRLCALASLPVDAPRPR